MVDKKPTDKETNALREAIAEALLEKKGEDIIELDVRGLSSVTDFFIICHADNETQIKALSNSVITTTDERVGEKPWHKEGLNARRWITLDYVNVVVHIFYKDLRYYYNLEKMWSDAPTVRIGDQ